MSMSLVIKLLVNKIYGMQLSLFFDSCHYDHNVIAIPACKALYNLNFLVVYH